ncbi:MAG TPA: glycoside hydrolase family 28 protein [Longimicrobiales bacterium]
MQNRRQFIYTAGIGTGALLLTRCATLGGNRAEAGWDEVPDILARIRPPVFPDRTFNVTQYGAMGDGKADCSSAFKQAIDACTQSGGGRVLVPEGRFLTGPVTLKSNVDLHVVRGGTIAFDTDPLKYVPPVFTRWEGVELMGISPFIYAFEQSNIAISGAGTLDGQADCDHWWNWRGAVECATKPTPNPQTAVRNRLFDMAEKGVPVAQRVFGVEDKLRPNFIQPYRCNNVLIEGVTVINSPMWEIHPVLCNNVTIRKVTVRTHGPNNDGCDPESCRDVLIEDCEFDTGDDCIAIKSGRNADGRRLNVPSENIIVRGCRFKDGHGGVTIGSEISGGCRNVFAENCVMDSPNLDRALRLKNNAMRGGLVENVYMRDVQVGQVADAVLQIDFHYEEGANGSFTPVARNINMSNITSQKSKYGVYLRGLPNAPIYDVRIVDADFRNVAQGNVTEHVRGIELENVRINGQRV